MIIADNDCLRELRPNYLRRLRQRVAFLDNLAQKIIGNGLTPETRAEIHRSAHSMASSAAIYGYNDLSIAARKVEAALSEPVADCFNVRPYLLELIANARCICSDGGCQEK